MSKIYFSTESNRKLPEHYSGKFKGSFAYLTIKDRLPVILVKVVDLLCRNKDHIITTYGKIATEEFKEVIGRLSALQNEMVTNKLMKPLCDNNEDTLLWNEYLIKSQESPTWFDVSWLLSECYFYRRIKQAFLLSTVLSEYDPFDKQKEESFFSTMEAVSFLCSTLNQSLAQLQNSNDQTFTFFRRFLEASLWGNKWDLSISAGKENIAYSNPMSELDDLRGKILANDTEEAYHLLSSASRPITIDYILDNAGFELFCDLCFLHFLLASKLVNKVNIYPKLMPWFVSDTLEKDIKWLLQTLSQSNDPCLVQFSESCSSNIESGNVTIVDEMFWTLPHDFSEMQSADPQLYQRLSQSDLTIFKGDLNYRKLTGDRQWEETVTFKEALNGFLPTSILALRTIKADVVVGLQPGTSDDLYKESQNWKYSGNYALVQFCKKETL